VTEELHKAMRSAKRMHSVLTLSPLTIDPSWQVDAETLRVLEILVGDAFEAGWRGAASALKVALKVQVKNDLVRERDGYFAEACRTKETLTRILPALEHASGKRADQFEADGAQTANEVAALSMARIILQSQHA